MTRVLCAIFIVGLLFSCKKAEERTCFKTTGDFAERDVAVAAFTELNLGKRLHYTLVHDTINFVRIKGGKNLIQSIRAETVAGVLFIENENRCNFLRSFAEIIEIEIHFVSLNRIEGRISHELYSSDTINGSFFNLEITGASGNAALVVNTDFLNGFVNDGNADYSFTGKTNYAHIQANSNGFADVRGLTVQEKLEVTSRSTRAIFCKADGIPLFVTIEATGDVYYTGTPSSISLIKTGAGNLIQVD
jgi:hypothetical protein